MRVKYPLVYHYKDTSKCENYDTMYMTVFKTPKVNAGKYKDMCIDGGRIGLGGTPTGGFYGGTGVTGRKGIIFDPGLAGVGVT